MSLTLVLTMWQETFTDVNIQTYISFFEHFDRSKFEYFFKPTKSDFDIFQFWLCIFPMNLVVLAHKIFKLDLYICFDIFVFLRIHWNDVTVAAKCRWEQKIRGIFCYIMLKEENILLVNLYEFTNVLICTKLKVKIIFNLQSFVI